MRFTADELALLADIHADPKSDGPRLAYADWLDKNCELGAGRMIRNQLSGDGDIEWLRDYGHPGPPQSRWRSGTCSIAGVCPKRIVGPHGDPPDIQKMSPRLGIWMDVHADGTLAERFSHAVAIRVSVLAVYSDFSVFRGPISVDAIRRLADWPQIDLIEGIKFYQPLSDEAERIFRDELADRVTVLVRQVQTDGGRYHPESPHPYPLARPYLIPRPYRFR